MYELAVFDWNGTVIADASACMAADNHVLKSFGGTPVDLQTYRDTIIIPAIDFYVQHGCNREELLANSQKLASVFHDFYEPRASRVRTRAGVRPTLEYLSEQGITSVILSNHTVEGIQAQLARLRLNEYFKDLLANSQRNTSMYGRNKGEKLQSYMEQNNYDPESVVIVGDSPEEQEIAQKLGITGVAITNGYYSTARLRISHPDFLIQRFSELMRIIDSNQIIG